MRFGVDFLHMLLDREGVGHVASFARDIQRISDKEEGVYEYDFDDKSREALTAARKRHFIREFGMTMGTGWFIARLGTTTVAGAKTVADGIDLYLGEKPEPVRDDVRTGRGDPPQEGIRKVRNAARNIYQVVEPPLGGPVELVIGGLLTAEGVHKWKEAR